MVSVDSHATRERAMTSVRTRSKQEATPCLMLETHLPQGAVNKQ